MEVDFTGEMKRIFNFMLINEAHFCRLEIECG